MSGEVAEQTQLFENVSRSFIEAVRQAMRVATYDEEGELSPLSQTDLAEQSGVGRSTLAKYLGSGQNESPANPTLDVICRLADSLGVPPAFLLMRPKDWSSIATGAMTFMQAVMKSTEVADQLSQLQAMGSTKPSEVADAALKLGKLLNTVENDQDTRLPQEVRDFRRSAKTSTATIAASIPFRYDAVSKNHLPVLLTLCGIAGTTTARN